MGDINGRITILSHCRHDPERHITMLTAVSSFLLMRTDFHIDPNSSTVSRTIYIYIY